MHAPAGTQPRDFAIRVAQELHPDELEKLRTRLLALLRAEGIQGSSTYRTRLFGPGRSLAQLESSTAGITDWKELPDNARKYLGRLSELLEVPIGLVSLGPKRHQTIQLGL